MRKEETTIYLDSYNNWLLEFKSLKFINNLSAIIYPLLIILWMFLKLNMPLILISSIVITIHTNLFIFSNISFRKVRFYKYIYKQNKKISKGEHTIGKTKYFVNIEGKFLIFKKSKSIS